MVMKGQPAPNTYKALTTVGLRNHDPTKWQSPGYTMRQKLDKDRPGLGPGLYRVTDATRFGPATAPRYTLGSKLQDPYDFISPGPLYYRPEKFYNAQQIPPKITMGRRTSLPNAKYAPSPNTYLLPSTLGPCVPDKPCNAAITMGIKKKTPRGEGIPAPNSYGPVKPNTYKPAAPRFTIRTKLRGVGDKTQKPAPNKYFPKNRDKEMRPKFSFGRKDSTSRMILFTLDGVKQCGN